MTWLTDAIFRLSAPAVLAVVFALPALEASTFLGVIFPGEIALVLGGVVAHSGRVPLWATVAAGAAGAIVGDSVGYAVGRGLGRSLLARLPRRLVRPDQVERAAALMRRMGGRAVFVGRFATALRALVPGLAGTASMPYRTFAAYNAAGGLLWATGFVLLGYAAGPAYRTVERIAGQAGLALLAAVVTGTAVALWVTRRRSSRPGHPRGPHVRRGRSGGGSDAAGALERDERSPAERRGQPERRGAEGVYGGERHRDRDPGGGEAADERRLDSAEPARRGGGRPDGRCGEVDDDESGQRERGREGA